MKDAIFLPPNNQRKIDIFIHCESTFQILFLSNTHWGKEPFFVSKFYDEKFEFLIFSAKIEIFHSVFFQQNWIFRTKLGFCPSV